MSTLSGIGNKGEKSKSKYQSVNINNLYKGSAAPTPKTAVSNRQHGLQSLGKVPSARRMPPPAQLPSLKSENLGNDPTVTLVPTGGAGWGTKEEQAKKRLLEGNTANAVQPSLQNLAPSTTTPVTSVATQERNSSPKATETSTGQVTVSVGVTTTAVVTITGPKSWSSVTMGRKQQGGVLDQKSPYFAEEFPKLDTCAEESSVSPQTKEEEPKPQYGPGPSLRPQNVGSWKEGGGRMHSQPSSSENAMNGQSPTSTSDTDIPMSGGSVASQQQHPRPGSGPPPAHMGHMMMPPNFRGMMPHYMYGRGYPAYPPNYNMTRAPYPYPGNHDIRYRGAPNRKDGEDTYKPPSIVKDKDLKEFDEIMRNDDRDGGWAGATGEVDYGAKLVFSDDEDESESASSNKEPSFRRVHTSKDTEDHPREKEKSRDYENERSKTERPRPPDSRDGWSSQPYARVGPHHGMDRQHWHRMQFEARPVAPPLRPGFPPQYRGMRPPYIVPGNDPDDELLDARRRHAEQSNAAVERARQKREEDDRKGDKWDDGEKKSLDRDNAGERRERSRTLSEDSDKRTDNGSGGNHSYSGSKLPPRFQKQQSTGSTGSNTPNQSAMRAGPGMPWSPYSPDPRDPRSWTMPWMHGRAQVDMPPGWDGPMRRGMPPPPYYDQFGPAGYEREYNSVGRGSYEHPDYDDRRSSERAARNDSKGAPRSSAESERERKDSRDATEPESRRYDSDEAERLEARDRPGDSDSCDAELEPRDVGHRRDFTSRNDGERSRGVKDWQSKSQGDQRDDELFEKSAAEDNDPFSKERTDKTSSEDKRLVESKTSTCAGTKENVDEYDSSFQKSSKRSAALAKTSKENIRTRSSSDGLEVLTVKAQNSEKEPRDKREERGSSITSERKILPLSNQMLQDQERRKSSFTVLGKRPSKEVSPSAAEESNAPKQEAVSASDKSSKVAIKENAPSTGKKNNLESSDKPWVEDTTSKETPPTRHKGDPGKPETLDRTVSRKDSRNRNFKSDDETRQRGRQTPQKSAWHETTDTGTKAWEGTVSSGAQWDAQPRKKDGYGRNGQQRRDERRDEYHWAEQNQHDWGEGNDYSQANRGGRGRGAGASSRGTREFVRGKGPRGRSVFSSRGRGRGEGRGREKTTADQKNKSTKLEEPSDFDEAKGLAKDERELTGTKVNLNSQEEKLEKEDKPITKVSRDKFGKKPVRQSKASVVSDDPNDKPTHTKDGRDLTNPWTKFPSVDEAEEEVPEEKSSRTESVIKPLMGDIPMKVRNRDNHKPLEAASAPIEDENSSEKTQVDSVHSSKTNLRSKGEQKKPRVDKNERFDQRGEKYERSDRGRGRGRGEVRARGRGKGQDGRGRGRGSVDSFPVTYRDDGRRYERRDERRGVRSENRGRGRGLSQTLPRGSRSRGRGGATSAPPTGHNSHYGENRHPSAEEEYDSLNDIGHWTDRQAPPRFRGEGGSSGRGRGRIGRGNFASTTSRPPKPQSPADPANLQSNFSDPVSGGEEWETASDGSVDSKSIPKNDRVRVAGSPTCGAPNSEQPKTNSASRSHSNRRQRNERPSAHYNGASGNGTRGQTKVSQPRKDTNLSTQQVYRAEAVAVDNTVIQNALSSINNNKIKTSTALTCTTKPKEPEVKASAVKTEKKPDALANIDINNIASVVVIDDRPEVTIHDPAFLYESNEGFQEVTSKKEKKLKHKVVEDNTTAGKKSSPEPEEEPKKKTKKESLEDKRKNKKYRGVSKRGSTKHLLTKPSFEVASAEADNSDLSRSKKGADAKRYSKLPPRLAKQREKEHKVNEFMLHCVNFSRQDKSTGDDGSENVDILPKIDSWDNTLVDEIATVFETTTSQPSNTEQIPVSAIPTSAVSQSNFALNMPIPAPAPSVNAWDKPISLSVHAPSSIVGAVAAKGGQDQHDSGIDISEAPNSASSSTRSSPNGDDQNDDPKGRRTGKARAGDKKTSRADDALRKDNKSKGLPQQQRQSVEPIQLPPSFIKNPFKGGKGEGSSEMKLEFTFDAELAMSEDKQTNKASASKSMQMASQAIGSVTSPTSPATEDLNQKIAKVKNVWECLPAMPTVFEQPTVDYSKHVPNEPSLASSNNAVVNQSMKPALDAAVAAGTQYGQHHQFSFSDGLHVSAPSVTALTAGMRASPLYSEEPPASNPTIRTSKTNEQSNVCKVRPQQQIATSVMGSSAILGLSCSPTLPSFVSSTMTGVPSPPTQPVIIAQQVSQYQQFPSPLVAPDTRYGFGMGQQQPAAMAQPAFTQVANLFLQTPPAQVHAADMYSAGGSQLGARYAASFCPPVTQQQSTIMVSSANSTLMSSAVKPPSQQSSYMASSSKNSSSLSVPFGGQYNGASQMFALYDAASTATTPQSQNLGSSFGNVSQMMSHRTAQGPQAMQGLGMGSSSFYSQQSPQPLQQTGFYQAQQQASSLGTNLSNMTNLPPPMQQPIGGHTGNQFSILSCFGSQPSSLSSVSHTQPPQQGGGPISQHQVGGSSLNKAAVPFKPAQQQQQPGNQFDGVSTNYGGYQMKTPDGSGFVNQQQSLGTAGYMNSIGNMLHGGNSNKNASKPSSFHSASQVLSGNQNYGLNKAGGFQQQSAAPRGPTNMPGPSPRFTSVTQNRNHYNQKNFGGAPPPASNSTAFKAQQAKQRQELLQETQAFLNPENKQKRSLGATTTTTTICTSIASFDAACTVSNINPTASLMETSVSNSEEVLRVQASPLVASTSAENAVTSETDGTIMTSQLESLETTLASSLDYVGPVPVKSSLLVAAEEPSLVPFDVGETGKCELEDASRESAPATSFEREFDVATVPENIEASREDCSVVSDEVLAFVEKEMPKLLAVPQPREEDVMRQDQVSAVEDVALADVPNQEQL